MFSEILSALILGFLIMFLTVIISTSPEVQTLNGYSNHVIIHYEGGKVVFCKNLVTEEVESIRIYQIAMKNYSVGDTIKVENEK